MTRLWPLAAVVLCACPQGAKEAPKLKAPEPLPQVAPGVQRLDGGGVDREALFQVEPFQPFGPARPAAAAVLKLEASLGELGGERFDLEDGAARARLVAKAGKGPLLLSPLGDTYVAQAAALLAALDDAGAAVLLLHPDGALAFPLTLRDEARFQAWLDEPIPGRVRVIQRADGFELTTGMGKLPGPDQNGPSVPVRGGQLDLATLRRGLLAVKGRFKDATDVCFLPSFGTPLADVAKAMAATWSAADRATFEEACLVYPRPGARDAGR